MTNFKELCKERNITLLPVSTKKVRAMALLLEGQYFIAYDESKFKSQEELLHALIHEYCHIVTATLHKVNETTIIDLNEDVANVFSDAYGTSWNIH